VATACLTTTAPAADADLTVSGTYRCAPDSASSRSRYAPAGHPSVGTVSEGPHRVLTVRVAPSTEGRRCRWPRIAGDRQTSRARSPRYQPIRNASTRNDRAVVDTYSGTGSPGRTLSRPV
jgi:hypothetical protein